MSVVDVTKMWSKSGGQFSSEKYDTFSNKYSLTEGYQVLTDSVEDDQEDVVLATGLPTFGDKYSLTVDAYVRSVTPQRIGPLLWQVLIGYEGVTFDETVDVEWTDTTSSEPIDRDYDGAAIVTVNGEPVDGLTMDISDPLVVIRRRFFTVNTFSIGAYRHATNSDDFLGWPPGTARLVGYSAKNQFKYGAPLEQWDVTARIQFRYPLAGATELQAWYKRWRHEGLFRLYRDPVTDVLDPTPTRALDRLGQEVSKPVLLKLNGEQETNPNNAVFVYSKVYGALPYSGLGLI